MPSTEATDAFRWGAGDMSHVGIYIGGEMVESGPISWLAGGRQPQGDESCARYDVANE